MAAEIAFLLLMLLLLYWVATGIYYLRRARYYRKTAQLERTRSRWAESRLALFRLVQEGRLDVKSQTFRTIYPVQTYILRHVGDYEVIAKQLVEGGIAKYSGPPAPWAEEVDSWPREMVTVFEKMSLGIAALINCYDPGIWPPKRIRTSKRFGFRKGPPRTSISSTDDLTGEQPVDAVLHNAKKHVEELESVVAGGGRNDSPGFMPAYG